MTVAACRDTHEAVFAARTQQHHAVGFAPASNDIHQIIWCCWQVSHCRFIVSPLPTSSPKQLDQDHSNSDSSNGQPSNAFAICESKKRDLLEAASQVEAVTVTVLPVYSWWSSAVYSRCHQSRHQTPVSITVYQLPQHQVMMNLWSAEFHSMTLLH